MIDVHCHLNFKAFSDDYDEVITRAFAAGVTKIINVGTKIDSSQRAVELTEKYDKLYAIVGVHPHHADKIEVEPRISHTDWLKVLELLAAHPKVVAIGECGMDYYRYKSNDIVDPKLQRDVFVKQIELAHKVKKPLQIHNRHAGKEIVTLLIDNRSYLLDPPGMFHCMSGNLELLKKVLDLGFYIGYDGNITYEGLAPGEETELAELVKATPIDRILIETDSPYLSPEPFRGSRNEPKNAIIVGQFIAKLKSISYEEVVSQTTSNVKTVFRI